MTDVKPTNVDRLFSEFVKEVRQTLSNYPESVMTKAEAKTLDPLVLAYIRENQEEVMGPYALLTESDHESDHAAFVGKVIEDMRARYKTRP